MREPKPDPFTGSWTPQSFSGRLSIRQNPTGFYEVQVDDQIVGPLEKDAEWNNLKSPDACLSLHGKEGRLFGMFRERGTYQTLAAVRALSAPLTGPVCGLDSPIFRRLIGPTFVLRTMRVNGLKAPAEVGDRIAIADSQDRGFYRIGKVQDGLFEPFDQLCPDASNGSLNSRFPQERGTTRNVTLWEMPGEQPRLFSMVAVARETWEQERDRAALDPRELAAELGLLPFELAALARAYTAFPAAAPGDPVIVWGAEDGGG